MTAALVAALVIGANHTRPAARAATAVGNQIGYPTVTDERLLNASKDEGWLMYRRAYDSQGYAPFDDISTSNVAQLKPVFTYDTGLNKGHEAPPIVNGRYMFITTPMNHLIALDATTGRVLWKYVASIPPITLQTICCDEVNRGVALYENNVYMATLDNRIIAFDAPTGKVVWNKQLMPPGVGYAMTGAPLIVEGSVVTGIAGGEWGGRCFVAALDAKTGKLKWKTYTIPAPGEVGGDSWPKGMYKTGGGGTWLTGSYDPQTRTLFWGVGNPGPWLADLRPGNNLYSDSVIALDPDSGHIKWYYQYTPHDTWDYDGTNESVLADIDYKGSLTKALLHADRNGNLYALDRTTGRFLWAKPFAKTLSVTAFAADGKPQTNPAARPHLGVSIFTCPSLLGAKNWWPTAFDPESQTIFVPTTLWCMTLKGVKTKYKTGLPYIGEKFKILAQPGSNGWGELQAIDARTGTSKWAYHTNPPWNGPLLATKGGLVFGGTLDRRFMAFDSATGKPLWTHRMSSAVIGVPTTYMVDGKQYVAVLAGYGGATPLYAGPAAKSVGKVPLGGRLYVFALSK
jgi:alcohol dehydrogenase (cytochrome c)